MFGWWRRRKESRVRVAADATAMIAEFGASAYYVVRDRALEHRLHKIVDVERTPEHWNLVRFEIRKRTGRQDADVATKYLGDGR
jgi:hypothetical protein